MATYDPKVISEFADRLYTRANAVIRNFTIFGVLVGLVVGASLAKTQSIWVVLLPIVIGGVIGYMLGKEKAFLYKLQAQTALCQVKIEQNTSKS